MTLSTRWRPWPWRRPWRRPSRRVRVSGERRAMGAGGSAQKAYTTHQTRVAVRGAHRTFTSHARSTPRSRPPPPVSHARYTSVRVRVACSVGLRMLRLLPLHVCRLPCSLASLLVAELVAAARAGWSPSALTQRTAAHMCLCIYCALYCEYIANFTPPRHPIMTPQSTSTAVQLYPVRSR